MSNHYNKIMPTHIERKCLRKFRNKSFEYPNGVIPKTDPDIANLKTYILENLIDDGFLEMGYDPQFDISGQPQQARNCYKVTEDGWHYQLFLVDTIQRFVLTHVITPVAVSIITTLVTLWIKSQWF